MNGAADDPSPEKLGALVDGLMQSSLWVAIEGTYATNQLAIGRSLAGSSPARFRVGRSDEGETFLPTATTRDRLVSSGYPLAGDTLAEFSFEVLAQVAFLAELDCLVINPGSVPFGRIARPLLAEVSARS